MRTLSCDKPLSRVKLHRILGCLVRSLIALYGERLSRIILYGSYAHGTAKAGSDIDTLVVLSGRVNAAKEIWAMGDGGRYDIELKYTVRLSAIPISERQYERTNSSFLKNVRKDGIVVYAQPANK